MGDVHIVMTIGFYLGILLTPNLPINTRGLAVPALRKQVFFSMFNLINESYKYFSIRSNIFHRNINKKLNIWIESIKRIFAVNDSMAITLMNLSYYSIIVTFNYESLSNPFRIKRVEFIILID